MFDHVKCVVGWTIMACHVYDLTYCKVMAIMVCDMQFEHTKAQQVMWTKLNDMVQKHNFSKLNFKGFMANSIKANWNVIIIVYGSRDPSMWMIDKEHTCLFH
jgi:hypothetical protein